MGMCSAAGRVRLDVGSNYRRRELQLQHDGSDGEESRSSLSGEDDEGSSSENASDQEGDLKDAGTAVEEPDQDSSDEL